MQKNANENRWTEWHDQKRPSASEASGTYPASKKTTEECIVVLLDICSAKIADNIIDADIFYEAFSNFVDGLEIIMEVLDNEAAPS